MVLLVAAVLLLFGVLAYVGSHRSKASSDHATTTTGTVRSTSRPGAGHSSPSTGRRSGTHPTRPPPTTLPTRLVATTSSVDGTSATYTVPFTSFTITINATGPCWASASTVATQTTLWSGELAAGGVQNIPASGATALDLGAPPVTLSVNGIPVVLPTPMHTPFVATFTPPIAPAGSASQVTAPSTSAPSSTTLPTTPSTNTPSSTAASAAASTTGAILSSSGAPVSATAPFAGAVRLQRFSRSRPRDREWALSRRARPRRG